MTLRRSCPNILPGLLLVGTLTATAAPGSDNAVTLYGAWRWGGCGVAIQGDAPTRADRQVGLSFVF